MGPSAALCRVQWTPRAVELPWGARVDPRCASRAVALSPFNTILVTADDDGDHDDRRGVKSATADDE